MLGCWEELFLVSKIHEEFISFLSHRECIEFWVAFPQFAQNTASHFLVSFVEEVKIASVKKESFNMRSVFCYLDALCALITTLEDKTIFENALEKICSLLTTFSLPEDGYFYTEKCMFSK